MKSEQVTLAWEFYRDNCEGFKEPMREELHRLDDYVASIESENAKLREELELWHRLTAGIELPEYPFNRLRWEELERENDKLRELVRDMMVAWWACDKERCPRHDKRCEEGKFCAFDECARDLGIEAGE